MGKRDPGESSDPAARRLLSSGCDLSLVLRTSLLGLLVVTASLTGCIGGTDDGLDEERVGDVEDASNLKASEDQLFHDPQTRSHPAYGYPTFTTVPQDAPGLPSWWEPIQPANATLEDLSLEHVGEDPDGDASYGTGIAIFGKLVIVPGRSTGNSWIFDISNPESPELISRFEAPGRDVDTLAFPDGRLFAVFATDGGAIPIWNITNPREPSKATLVSPDRGSHNVGIVPGTPILYNSASRGGGAGSNLETLAAEGTAIYDLSDPSQPELLQDFENGYSCHDISFSIRTDQGEYRAYCAGHEVTQIWDIEDPADPRVISTIPVHHGTPDFPSTGGTIARFSHLAMTDQTGDVLIVGDETGGGGAPGCDATLQQAPRTVSGPLGNLYFYDISDEEDPEYMGSISPNSTALMTDEVQEDPRRGVSPCTAHFGRLVPHPERALFAVAFYGRGVNVIDFTEPTNPRIVDQWNDGTNTWDVWYYNGYLFTGDTARGMDVLRIGSSP